VSDGHIRSTLKLIAHGTVFSYNCATTIKWVLGSLSYKFLASKLSRLRVFAMASPGNIKQKLFFAFLFFYSFDNIDFEVGLLFIFYVFQYYKLADGTN
jgi:hypothetical protein